jgi:hypothetical protein
MRANENESARGRERERASERGSARARPSPVSAECRMLYAPISCARTQLQLTPARAWDSGESRRGCRFLLECGCGCHIPLESWNVAASGCHIPPEYLEYSMWLPRLPECAQTAALAEGGVLWVWGFGRYGHLGLDDVDHRLVPSKEARRCHRHRQRRHRFRSLPVAPNCFRKPCFRFQNCFWKRRHRSQSLPGSLPSDMVNLPGH